MGIYDRDYMRKDSDEPPPDASLAEHVAAFCRRHPLLVTIAIGILIALLILALAGLFPGK